AHAVPRTPARRRRELGTDGRHCCACHYDCKSLSLSRNACGASDAEFSRRRTQRGIDSYALTNFTRDNLELFIARRYVDDKTRAALETIIALKDKVAAASSRLAGIDKEAAEIAQD